MNESDTTTLEPSWTFKPESTTASADFTPMTAWVWQLPQAAYPLDGTGSNQISFTPGANLFTSTANSTFFSTCNVTVPFPTWTINRPVLTGLSPTSQDIGDVVTIEGQYLYDGMTVLLGGAEVASSNLVFSTMSTTSFTLTVPSGTSIGDNEILVSTTVSTASGGTQTLQSATGLTLNVTSD